MTYCRIASKPGRTCQKSPHLVATPVTAAEVLEELRQLRASLAIYRSMVDRFIKDWSVWGTERLPRP
jgi:hypothetical protein